MGLVESAQMAQDWYLHKEEMQFNKQSIVLDKKSLTIDLVNTIREDLRDLFQSRAVRIDNLMLVNTLLLSFSFGFVCEAALLIIYCILCAMTLVAPFWSIWFGLECKQKLDSFLNEILTQRTDDRLRLETWIGFYNAFALYWSSQCQWYYKIALNLFWIGMLFALTLCCVLLLLVFEDLFPYDYLGALFVGIVGSNIFIALGLITKKCIYWCFHLGAANDIMLKNLIQDEFTDTVKPFKGVEELSTPLLVDNNSPLLVNQMSPTMNKLRPAFNSTRSMPSKINT